MHSIFWVLLLYLGCTGSGFANHYSELFNDISLKTATQIENEFPNLQLFGLGGASDDDYVKLKELVFRVKGKLDKPQGTIIIHTEEWYL